MKEALLTKLEQRYRLYPVVTNVIEQSLTTVELVLRIRRKYSVEQQMRHLESTLKIRPVCLHIEELIRGLAVLTITTLMANCLLVYLAKKTLIQKRLPIN